MAKAIFEFDLNDPDSKRVWKTHCEAESMKIVLYDFYTYMCGMTKHAQQLGDTPIETAERVFDTLKDMLNDEGIDVYE